MLTERVKLVKLTTSELPMKRKRLLFVGNVIVSEANGPVRSRVRGLTVANSKGITNPTKSFGLPKADGGTVLMNSPAGSVILVAASRSVPGDIVMGSPAGTKPK